jgi:hypothetical protein
MRQDQAMRDITYPPIIVAAKLGFRALDLRFQMTGTEHIPRTGGALLAVNHISYVDFVLGGSAPTPEEATTLDAEERRRRAERRRERAAQRAAKRR